MESARISFSGLSTAISTIACEASMVSRNTVETSRSRTASPSGLESWRFKERPTRSEASVRRFSARSSVAANCSLISPARSTHEMVPASRTASRTNDSVSRAFRFMDVSRHGENELAGGAAAFQVAVSLGRVGEGIGAADAQAQLAGCNPAEHVAGAPEQLVAGRQVIWQPGPGEEERALGAEDGGIEGRNRSARLAEQRQQAARAQRVEALLESGPGHRIVDHVHAAAGGEALDPSREILLGIEDGFVAAVFAGDARFLLGGYSAENARAEHLRHLDDESAGAAGRRVRSVGR